MSTLDDSQAASARAADPGENELAALWEAAEGDQSVLESLWQAHGKRLLEAVCAFASSRDMDRALGSNLKAAQLVLEISACKGNIALFQHMLHRLQPQPEDIGGSQSGIVLRLCALHRGVEIWKALLAYNPECLDWDIGGGGDPLAQAVLSKDTQLVRVFLAQGADVRWSNFMLIPVLSCAKRWNAGPEIVALLTSYGAPAGETLTLQ